MDASQPFTFDTILKMLGGVSLTERAQLTVGLSEGLAAIGEHQVWMPNPGPQTEAYECEADELFFGGQAGPGKTALGVGLALTRHENTLMLRRTNKEADGLVDEVEAVVGNRQGYNSQKGTWRIGKRTITMGGCQLERDKQKRKGKPNDLMVFDEISDFTRTQYQFITTWNRTVTPAQRCRVLAAGNPPTTPEGLWVLEHWAAWLDPNHPNPAEPGELRWYTTGEEGREIEVDGPGPHMIGGQLVRAKSRTFIRGTLADNPDLAATNYDAVLAALPDEYRKAYREGRFDAGLKDRAFQCIPTGWVRQAQDRWTEKPPIMTPMCAIGVDVAQGGADDTVLAVRHDGWYAPLVAIPGRQTPDGASVAAAIVALRRDRATPIIDMGGGYGGAAYEWLRDNGVECVAYKGASNEAPGRTVDGRLKFRNNRSKAYWRFREALEPGQPGGSRIQLPPDPILVADLTAPSFKIGPNGVELEAKEKVTERLGRSPDRGDAVVMAWWAGVKMENVQGGLGEMAALEDQRRNPQVIMGHGRSRQPNRYRRGG